MLAADPEVSIRRHLARSGRAGSGPPAACPISARPGPSITARLVARLFTHLSEGDGRIPQALVCRAGRAARQCPGRHRHARRPDRGRADLGLYRPPRRLARRSRGDGRAHHGGRGEALRRAARAADPALRRPAHRRADARSRQEGRGRVPGASSTPRARSASAPMRSAGSAASPSRSIRPRAMPTARCCSPPPSGGSAGEYEKRAAALVADDGRAISRCAPRRASRSPSSGAAMRWRGSGRARICSARASCSTGGSSASRTRAARR